ncbi:MAG TPA: efflux RND transporter periplasmic adaptor subunit [Vicinamibacteria bacterium]|nr:efflux RND transporter periplasmic adaptor subunit [Vicinamibacteria bacterium]
MSRPARPAVPALLAAALGLAALSGGGSAAPPPGFAGMPVTIEAVRIGPVDDSSEYVAALRSRGSVAIMPQVEGHITRILVRSGARVEAGQALMQIDPAKQEATVRSQEDMRAAKVAALEFVRQHYDRVKGLFASGVTSQQDLDQARTALDAAQADLDAVASQVRQQKEELRYYRVAAPAAGVVGDVPVRLGDRVSVSTLLTTVDSPGVLEAYLSVPVERASVLRPGMPVRILDSTGQVVAESRITFLSPQVDDQTQTVLVKAGIQDRGPLRPDQFVRARVVWGSQERPVVPVLAVSRISGQYFVFVAEPAEAGLVARQRPVKVGEIVGNDYVVLEGVKAGERVIVSGTQFLRDGVPVIPQT